MALQACSGRASSAHQPCELALGPSTCRAVSGSVTAVAKADARIIATLQAVAEGDGVCPRARNTTHAQRFGCLLRDVRQKNEEERSPARNSCTGVMMLGAVTLPLLPICPPSNWFYRG